MQRRKERKEIQGFDLTLLMIEFSKATKINELP
jgi:hypothetical protein